jgi:hypothetical protein
MPENKKLTFEPQADLHLVRNKVPILSDGTEVAVAADANGVMR